ncbi:MAG: hypothetical protein JSS83_05800 [Cyanobacteria bacterium SZAS LIN-3]|nr:hypothetical protein [Cyanobacteria bacterium SZAS LIN-3]MBS2010823.1 hypothetical protein [Cyanobacteria bacterium SZAS TMP-1]
MQRNGNSFYKIVGGALVVILALGLVLGLHGCSDNTDNAPARTLPRSFTVDERVFFKWGETFDVDDGSTKYGTVHEQLVSWTPTFYYRDNTGALAATASVAILSWGTQIDVVDGQGKKLGTIKEEVFSSFLKTWTTYKILDADGKEVATSQKSEWFATNFELTANDGHVVAEVHRGMWNWTGDTWYVTIKDSVTVDPRIELMIAAFKTHADNEKKAKDSKKSDDKKSSGGAKK